MPDYPHIHLRNLGQASKKFRSRGMNSSPPPSPVENRKEHAAKLRTQLVSLAGEITEFAKDQKLAGVENKRRGVPVTAIGRVDEQLRVGALKLNSQGLELLSLKERGSASQEKRRSEEHTSELQSLMRISYAVFCLKNKTKHKNFTYSTETERTLTTISNPLLGRNHRLTNHPAAHATARAHIR